ncbi:unnamed protein product [Danaus chrysippus]|uniref:(African queen) hypothetical protein n=1 Tax=Danaus chrysippus TaxID=151541 RepID=A0A8J2R455_9NEOP|nr:unnamed protein product [Danaus chrysippus]
MVSLVPLHAVITLHMVLGTLSQYLQGPGFQNPSMQSMRANIPGPLVLNSAMQMPIGYPQQRLPVVMMPYHSKAADKKYLKHKKRRPKKYYRESESTSSSDSDESCSSSNEYLRPRRRSGHKRKRQVLTPVISYVTRNGRVVYQKKIKKDNAGDWLDIGKKKIPSRLVEEMRDQESGEMTIRDLKHKYGLKSAHNHDHK